MKEKLSKIAQSCNIPSKTEDSIESAFKGIARQNDNAIIFCTGSLYFAGEILNLNQMFSLIQETIFDFVVAPTLVALSSPPLKSNIVGMPRTPYFVG